MKRISLLLTVLTTILLAHSKPAEDSTSTYKKHSEIVNGINIRFQQLEQSYQYESAKIEWDAKQKQKQLDEYYRDTKASLQGQLELLNTFPADSVRIKK